jgi:predicted SprT family Zn-dependent metalloprotease
MTTHPDAMGRDEIVAAIETELARFGLTSWTAALNDRMVSCYGIARYRERRIEVSWPIAQLNGRDETLDTIRHEVAHAIAGPKAGHGDEWKDACGLTGARPVACFDGKAVATPWTYAIVCDGCGEIVGHRSRRSSRAIYHYPEACDPAHLDNRKARQFRWVHRDDLDAADRG